MSGHTSLLSTFLAEHEPSLVAVVLEVLDAHAGQGTDSDEAEEHDCEEGTVAQSQWVSVDVEGLEKPPSLLACEHGGLALEADKAEGADVESRVGRKGTVTGEPCEPLTNGGEMEVGAGGAEPLGEVVDTWVEHHRHSSVRDWVINPVERPVLTPVLTPATRAQR